MGVFVEATPLAVDFDDQSPVTMVGRCGTGLM